MYDFFLPFDFEVKLKLLYKRKLYLESRRFLPETWRIAILFVHVFVLSQDLPVLPRLPGICDLPSLSAEMKGVHHRVWQELLNLHFKIEVLGKGEKLYIETFDTDSQKKYKPDCQVLYDSWSEKKILITKTYSVFKNKSMI